MGWSAERADGVVVGFIAIILLAAWECDVLPIVFTEPILTGLLLVSQNIASKGRTMQGNGRVGEHRRP